MNTTPSPYLLLEPPTSTGRAVLSRAFTHWCALHDGYNPVEIAEALETPAVAERRAVQKVRFAARLLGELIAAGRLRTFARPLGGGSPAPIPAGHWELDDFTRRFATSMIDPAQPFDAEGTPTHWIFVDLEDFNGLVEESCADLQPVERAARVIRRMAPEEQTTTSAPSSSDNDHVRLPEVMRRTGMSRSTIYRRIEQGRFPSQIEMDGNIAAWREGDVAAWLADPR